MPQDDGVEVEMDGSGLVQGQNRHLIHRLVYHVEACARRDDPTLPGRNDSLECFATGTLDDDT